MLKNYGVREDWGPLIFDIPIDIQYSNKLAYLQLITVLTYGSSPPKNH